MVANKSSGASERGRVGIIHAVQTPLGFFVLVVLIVEAMLGVFTFKLDGVERFSVIQYMIVLVFLLVLIVAAIAVWRPQAFSGKERQYKESKYSLLVGPPAKLPNLNVTLINWDNDACFLVYGDLKEKIALVPSRIGPTFRVNIPPKLLERVENDAVALELRDKRGNRWEVRNFYLYENLLPLSLCENVEKIIQDYGEEDQ